MPTYAEVAHLVDGVHAEDDEVHLHFVADCGLFEQTVTVSRSATAGKQGEGPRNSSRRALKAWLKLTFRRVLRGASPPPTAALSQSELEEATMTAFQQIASKLTRIGGRWVALLSSEQPGEFFARQLSAAPIVEGYDLEVLARVLLEVSRSDSTTRLEEKAFLKEVVKDEGMLRRLQKAPPITVAELAEVTSLEVKQTILLLAWTVAYADGSLDGEEMSRLSHLCRGFMLPDQRVRELQLAAKLALLDRYLQAQRGQVTPAELRENFDNQARAWGVCEKNLAKLRAWYPEDFPEDSARLQPLSASDDG